MHSLLTYCKNNALLSNVLVVILWRALSSLCMIIACIAQGTVFAQDVNTLRKGIVKLVATADGKQKTGTGFVVKHDSHATYIVTAYHVVEGDKYPKVAFFGQRHLLIEAEVLQNDRRNDISLLKVRQNTEVPADVEALVFSTSEDIKDDEELSAIGFPASLSWVRVPITLASQEGLDLIISGNINEGFSGAPILIRGKEVIGMITSTDDYGRALPAEIVIRALKGWEVTLDEGGGFATSNTTNNTTSQPPRSRDSKTSTPTAAKPQSAARLPFEPEMVRISPGKFLMGSPATEQDRTDNEGPQHQVTIQQPFAVSRYEITVGQFRQFVQDKDYHRKETYLTAAEQHGKGCYAWNMQKKQFEQLPERNWENPGFEQGDDHPVVCVSWLDAQENVVWLSTKTGKKYRLLTEAEWEYAARAGTQTAYWWGNNIGKNNAVCNGCGSQWDMRQTAPVGSFKPNAFGLYDTAGNVWEWTQDCWHDNYQKAPRDGSAWLEANDGKCGRPVVRGGSWNVYPQILRSTVRSRGGTDEAVSSLGFRVARDF